MPKKETVRVALFISPEYRDMVNQIAKHNNRGQKAQVELMIKKDFNKLKLDK